MAGKRRKSVSINGERYEQIKKYCDEQDWSVAGFLEFAALKHINTEAHKKVTKEKP